MKKLSILLLAALLILSLGLTAFAAADNVYMVDGAGLFSEDEVREMNTMLAEASEELQFDIVVVTTDSLNGKNSMDYADDFYDYNHYGYGDTDDGALMLISMDPENRCCWISTCGYGQTALNSRIEDMLDVVVDEDLAYGQYAQSVYDFARLCRKYVEGSRADEQFSMEKVAKWLFFGLIFGLIVGAIYIGILKSGMKSVKMQAGANNYIKQGSLNITNSSELFLYTNVSRVRRESSSSSGGSHTSSSGASHGGGGRSF